MAQCARCQHELGVGRFCTNCGLPIGAGPDERTDTAERPAVSEKAIGRPGTPPPAYAPPAPPRYPLFADEVGSAPETVIATAWEVAHPAPPGRRIRRRRRGPWPLVATIVVLVVVAGVGAVLLGSGNGDDHAADPGASSPPDHDTSTSPSSAAPKTPPPTSPAVPGEPAEVARDATATVPDTAAPSRDVNGNAVRYQAFNMLDGVSDTAWRTPGSAAGQEIVVRLAATTELTTVGLVNGYAKQEPGYDGYAANRRITRVEWVFDDGTVVPQTLDQVTGLQTIDVGQVRTDTVHLRIVEVTSPGKGRSGRDYTAISELSLLGTPG